MREPVSPEGKLCFAGPMLFNHFTVEHFDYVSTLLSLSCKIEIVICLKTKLTNFNR